MGYNLRKLVLTWSRFTGEGTDMTATRHIHLPNSDASPRRMGGFAPFGYYFGYFTAGAEMV